MWRNEHVTQHMHMHGAIVHLITCYLSPRIRMHARCASLESTQTSACWQQSKQHKPMQRIKLQSEHSKGRQCVSFRPSVHCYTHKSIPTAYSTHIKRRTRDGIAQSHQISPAVLCAAVLCACRCCCVAVCVVCLRVVAVSFDEWCPCVVCCCCCCVCVCCVVVTWWYEYRDGFVLTHDADLAIVATVLTIDVDHLHTQCG